MSSTAPALGSTEAALRRLHCDLVISKYAAASMGAGFIPLPIVDFMAVGGVQLTLLYRLCRIHGVPFSAEAARSVIGSLVAAAVPGGFQPLFLASGLKAIPVLGTAVGQFATPALAGATTYAIGKVFVKHLESGGTLLDFSAQGMKEHFEKAMDAAKNAVGSDPRQ